MSGAPPVDVPSGVDVALVLDVRPSVGVVPRADAGLPADVPSPVSRGLR